MSFRTEKKFRLTTSEYFAMKQSLIIKGMKPLFEKRNVNSIYFDNSNLDMFSQSEEGVLPRKKIRVRWYDNLNKFSLEKKISSIEGRFKVNNDLHKVKTKSEILKIRLYDPDYGLISPILKVSYKRGYYILNDMRITFDSNIYYKNLLQHNFTFKDIECVIELKSSDINIDDYINGLFPYPNSRFSKYCRGLIFTHVN